MDLNDADVFAILSNVVSHQVGVIRRLLRTREEVEDMRQDAWEAAAAACSKIGTPTRPWQIKYLHLYVRYWLRDRIRYHQVRNNIRYVGLGDFNALDPAGEFLESSDTAMIVEELLHNACLTADQRGLLRDIYWREMSFSDIARRNGYCRAAVKYRHDKTLSTVREANGIPEPLHKQRKEYRRPTREEMEPVRGRDTGRSDRRRRLMGA